MERRRSTTGLGRSVLSLRLCTLGLLTTSVLPLRPQNNIPVFCPALTDGSLGDMLYFHSYKSAHPLVIDIVSDIRNLNDMSVRAKRAGMVILGGGVCKHQIANAMLFVRPSFPRQLFSHVLMSSLFLLSQRNGADYAVYINTGQEYDGSDSGARPDEAVSWGKIKADAKAVKVRLLSFSLSELILQARC